MTKFFDETLGLFNKMRPELNEFRISNALMKAAEIRVKNIKNQQNVKSKLPRSLQLYKTIEVVLDNVIGDDFLQFTNQLRTEFDRNFINVHNADIDRIGFYIDIDETQTNNANTKRKLIACIFLASKRLNILKDQILRENYACLGNYTNKPEPRLSDDFSDLKNTLSEFRNFNKSQPKLFLDTGRSQSSTKFILPKSDSGSLSDDDMFSFETSQQSQPNLSIKVPQKTGLSLSASAFSDVSSNKRKPKSKTMDLTNIINKTRSFNINPKLVAFKDNDDDDLHNFDF